MNVGYNEFYFGLYEEGAAAPELSAAYLCSKITGDDLFQLARDQYECSDDIEDVIMLDNAAPTSPKLQKAKKSFAKIEGLSGMDNIAEVVAMSTVSVVVLLALIYQTLRSKPKPARRPRYSDKLEVDSSISVTDDEMANSAFGQGSYTARHLFRR